MGEPTVGSHQAVGMPCGDLDMIAENGIMPDLQGSDAGCIPVTRFERGNGAATVGRCRAKCIERRVIALGDIAAFRSIDWRRFDEGDPELVDHRGMTAKHW